MASPSARSSLNDVATQRSAKMLVPLGPDVSRKPVNTRANPVWDEMFFASKYIPSLTGLLLKDEIVSTNILSLRDNNELFKDKIAHFARGGHIIPQKNNLSKAALLKL
jgi:hypothetical protein